VKLQIHESESPGEVVKYLHGKHSLEAYYSQGEQEIVGDWGGKGAEMLGLKGVVKTEEFARLVHNLHPFTGEQLTDRMRKDRIPGFDMVWNVPKSVSLVYAYTKDERIVQALRETVAEVMEIAQKQAAVRVRKGDKNRDDNRITEWLITAEHIHLTARPEDGYSDPHLHLHLYVPNVSWDPEDKKFKALQMRRIWDMADKLEELATARFAEKLQAIGLRLEQTGYAFEIEGFYQELRDKFSRRTITIEKTAERLGITDPAQKAKLAAVTRQNKIKDVKIEEFEPIWWGSLTPREEKPFKAAATRLTLSRTMGMARVAAMPDGVSKIEVEPAAMKSTLGGKDAAWAGRFFSSTPDGQGLSINPTVRPRPIEAEPAAIKSSLGSKDAAWAEEILSHQQAGRRVSMNQATRPRPSPKRRIEPNEYDRRAVAFAIEHLLERNSVVTDIEIVAEASKNWSPEKETTVGKDKTVVTEKKTTVAGIWQALEEAPLCWIEKDGRRWATTKQILAEENFIVEKCLADKGRFEPINEFWKIRDEELTAEQRACAQMMLNSRDRISAIKGKPGVGKTKVLKEIKRGVESGGYKMIALSPGADAAYRILRNEGFENAQTAAHLLTSQLAQDEARGAVWLVDEAAKLSTPDGAALYALAEKLDARVILVGDDAQHLPVERGHAFRLLEERGKMETAQIAEIHRQDGDYRRIVEHILAKRTDAAIDLMQKMGNVHEMKLEERKRALAEEYVAALERGETAGIVAPTHRERRAMQQSVRDVLKEKGMLKEAHSAKVTRDLNWNDGQKSNPAEYKIGMRVEIESPVKGFNMNEQLEVVAVRDDMVRVRSLHPHATKTHSLPLHAPECFKVFETVEENGCERDILRNLHWSEAQRSDAEHYKPGLVVQINAHLDGYALGEHLEVVRVSDDGVKAVNAKGKYKLLPLEYPDAFSVNEKDRIEICEGETIRMTANGRTAEGHRVYNGGTYKVEHVAYDGTILLDNGWNLGREFKNIDWAHGGTSHAMQGMTFDRIFIAQSVDLSAGASDLRQFLVSVSRGRKGVKLYTDDLEKLREFVSRERESLLATEVFQERTNEKRIELAEEQLPLAAKLGHVREPDVELKQELEAVRCGREAAQQEQKMEQEMEMSL
jgi:conjugative relaxase-like TrwC/TraI family protein